MDHRPSVSNLTSRYDDFLFAPVCDEPSGMQLSVVSALARINVDPWEEATRLAAMPKAIAETALVSDLNLVSGQGWESSEAPAIAARLVRLLPQRNDGSTAAATQIAAVRAQRTSYWIVWMGVVIAISILSPHHRAMTTGAGSVPTSNAAFPTKSGSANTVLPGLSGQSD